MNYLIIPLVAVALFTGSPAIEAKCKQPEPGPTGPLTTDYISATSDSLLQEYDTILEEFQLVEFPFTTAQNNILHPNATDFVLEHDGVYLITWSGTSVTNYNVGESNIPPGLWVVLLVNGNELSPMVTSFHSVVPVDISETPDAISFTSLSGQTLLQLDANDTLQLIAAPFGDPSTQGTIFAITDFHFTVTRVAEPLLEL